MRKRNAKSEAKLVASKEKNRVLAAAVAELNVKVIVVDREKKECSRRIEETKAALAASETERRRLSEQLEANEVYLFQEDG